jgi:adenosine deaminase
MQVEIYEWHSHLEPQIKALMNKYARFYRLDISTKDVDVYEVDFESKVNEDIFKLEFQKLFS